MANTIAIQKINDGPRNVVVNVYLKSDGSTGDVTDSVIIGASSLSGSFTTIKIDKIEACFTGFSGILEFDGSTDAPFLHIPDGQPVLFDWCKIAGITNNAVAPTGDITLTTTGFTAATDQGTLTIFGIKS
jgi:hypothetical protein